MANGGESPEDAGARELLEETGFRGERVIRIGSVFPNPALQNNVCHTVLVEGGARRVADPTPDPAEEIETELIPLAEIPRRIGEGEITHALVVAAFYHLAILGPSRGGSSNAAGRG